MIERSSIENALRNEISNPKHYTNYRYAMEYLKELALDGLEVAARSGLAFSSRQSDLLAKVSGSNVKHWVVQSDRMRDNG